LLQAICKLNLLCFIVIITMLDIIRANRTDNFYFDNFWYSKYNDPPSPKSLEYYRKVCKIDCICLYFIACLVAYETRKIFCVFGQFLVRRLWWMTFYNVFVAYETRNHLSCIYIAVPYNLYECLLTMSQSKDLYSKICVHNFFARKNHQ